MVQNETEGKLGYGVNRILLLSPMQAELAKRTGSRIFITTQGDSLIDTAIFQAQRPIENYIEAASKAIALAGLHPLKGDLSLRAAFNPSVADGLFQNHIVANTWLMDDRDEVYDLYLEVVPHGVEDLRDPGITTTNANRVDGNADNPLIFIAGVEELVPDRQDFDFTEQLIEREGGQNIGDNDRIPGARGRVKNPAEDRRLRENRSPQLESARRAQTTDQNNDQMARQAGKPGRVRAPAIDFRRKDLRQIAGAMSAGR